MEGYKTYQGRIKEITSYQYKDGITLYTIGNCTLGTSKKSQFKNNQIFYNIKHGYNSDPESSDGCYKIGTPVYFFADDANDGVIIAAVRDNPGVYDKLNSDSGANILNAFNDNSEIPITPGDWVKKKLEGFIGIFYSGLVRLRANLETEIIIDPILSGIQNICKRFSLKLGSHGLMQFSMSEDQATSNFDFLLFNDTSGTKTDGSLIHIKIGQHEDDEKRLSLTIADTLDGTLKHNIELDKNGKLSIFSKEVSFNINDKASLDIDSEGNIVQKQVKLSIGDQNASQNMIRGTKLKENYDSHLDLEISHGHIIVPTSTGLIAIPSTDLLPLNAKKLQVDVELSKDKFIN